MRNLLGITVMVAAIGALEGAAACGGSSSNVNDAPQDAGPDSPGVHSTEDARRAYLGLDKSVDKAIALGFQGYNAASNANIPTQEATGDKTGKMAVGGQVDQGQSNNKTMRLTDTLTAYSDDGIIAYDTAGGTPAELDMTLNKIPDGTLTGSLKGSFQMSGAKLEDGGIVSQDAGALVGSVTLDLTFTGQLQPTSADATKVERKPGTTHITGTASAGPYTYNVDVTR